LDAKDSDSNPEDLDLDSSRQDLDSDSAHCDALNIQSLISNDDDRCSALCVALRGVDSSLQASHLAQCEDTVKPRIEAEAGSRLEAGSCIQARARRQRRRGVWEGV